MILSRLLLNPTSRDVQRDLGDIYQLHRSVMSGFPTELPADERVLFRLDTSRDGQLSLLVQSQTMPEWDRLRPRYLIEPDPFDPVPNPAIKPVLPAFRTGQLLRFRLRANPTVRKPAAEGGTGRRVGIIGEEAQLAWLTRKGQAGGFSPLDGVNVATLGRSFGLTRRQATDGPDESSDRRRLELLVVQFDGVLKVTDPGRFAAAVNQGIGSAKGFGCGLLSLGPA